MTYRLLRSKDDNDIPTILSAYNHPSISRFISIDKENYWQYIANTDNVYFYKIYKDSVFAATIHLEINNRVLYLSVVVFPEYQNKGLATIIINDIQSGKLGLEFDKIQISIDQNNHASIKLFENAAFICIGKDKELFEYEYQKN